MSEVVTNDALIRKGIGEEVSAILDVYYEIVRVLRGVPPNEELQEWLRHMERTLDIMKAQYVENYHTIDLGVAKRTKEPISVFSRLGSRYMEVERGFANQIKEGNLYKRIRTMFDDDPEPHFKALQHLIAEIPASYAEI